MFKAFSRISNAMYIVCSISNPSFIVYNIYAKMYQAPRLLFWYGVKGHVEHEENPGYEASADAGIKITHSNNWMKACSLELKMYIYNIYIYQAAFLVWGQRSC